MVEIREIHSRSEIKQFIRFPNDLYRNHPYYSAPMELDELTNLLPGKNAAYAYCDARFWLAYRDGKIVGRVCGIHSKLSNERWNQKRLRFSRLDFIDDREVSRALIGAVEDWARELGMEEVQGPIGFCDIDFEGMLIEGFEEKNLFITIYSAPYYREHLEALGYGKAADWVERRITMPQELDPKYARVSEFILKKKSLRVLEFKKSKEILPYANPFFKLINICYHDLYGTVPLSQEMIDQYRDRFFGFVNPDYICFIVDKEDNLVAAGVSIPSLANACRVNDGRLFPTGWYHFLHDLKKNDTLELLLVAVHPDYQNLGLNGVMIHEIHKKAIKNGIKYAETGPTLENNFAIQAQWGSMEARIHKRRRCFIKTL